MKEIETTTTISETKYECSNCGTVHDEKEYITVCELCGKEVCTNCSDTKYTYPLNIMEISQDDIFMTGYTGYSGSSNKSYFMPQTPHALCENCASRISHQDFSVYKSKIAQLVQGFNRKLGLLTKDYLKGNIDV